MLQIRLLCLIFNGMVGIVCNCGIIGIVHLFWKLQSATGVIIIDNCENLY